MGFTNEQREKLKMALYVSGCTLYDTFHEGRVVTHVVVGDVNVDEAKAILGKASSAYTVSLQWILDSMDVRKRGISSPAIKAAVADGSALTDKVR